MNFDRAPSRNTEERELKAPAWSRLGNRSARVGLGALSTPPRRDRRGASSRLLLASAACSALWIAALTLLAVGAPPALAAGDVNQSSCPTSTEESPGFRDFLPDCRAYELVSPSYKEGARAVLLAASPEGSSAIVESLGNLGDDEGTGSIGIYALRRGASGWTEESIEPPASQYSYNAYLDSTPSLDASLFLARSTSQSEYDYDYVIREADGFVRDLGPVLPPEATEGPPSYGPDVGPAEHVTFMGASADLSRVLFRLEGFLTPHWPGDTTEPSADVPSLYEYSTGRSGRPALVGVDDEGQLIGECGVGLGSLEDSGPGGGNQTPGDISADGSVVFFTVYGSHEHKCSPQYHQPPVDEVFARIGGSRTVAISEPDALPGGNLPAGCESAECHEDVGIEADWRDAKFAGASSDGSKVFFLSTQQLTDEGGEDTDPEDSASRSGCAETSGTDGCNLYEYEGLGGPSPQVVDASVGPEARVQGVVAVSEDGSHVYFVAKGVLAGAQANEYGATALPGEDNLYVYERDARYPEGHVAFIATLSPEDSSEWSALEDTIATATPDGQFLAFTSLADLTPDDTSEGVEQIFRYDAPTGELVRVSVGQKAPEGLAGYECPLTHAIEARFNCDGNTSAFPASLPPHIGSLYARPALSISGDGSDVVFASADGLTPNALDGQPTERYGAHAKNVYEYSEGNVYLISDGQDASNLETHSAVGLDGLSATGDDVFFQTDDPLVPQDGNTQQDIYDARVDGGMPGEEASASCAGDACQGAPDTVPPPFASPASATYPGAGDLAPKPPPKSGARKMAGRCPKDKRLTHGNCVRRRRPKSKKAKANTKGRSNRVGK